MANRTYFVKKDGAIIKELKSLSGAKKIALAESADVYCGDELVFSPSDGGEEEACDVVKEADSQAEEPVRVEKEANIQTEEPGSVEKEADDQTEEAVRAEKDDGEMKYRLKALMNVRTSPSLSSRKIATLLPGTIVSVDKIKNDWLHLTNGSFIFYGNGKYAEKVQ